MLLKDLWWDGRYAVQNLPDGTRFHVLKSDRDGSYAILHYRVKPVEMVQKWADIDALQAQCIVHELTTNLTPKGNDT
jgi:hypothetical protein